MRLDIKDGYTLPFATSPESKDAGGQVIQTGLPVVTGTYRPALYEDLHAFRYAYNRAASGLEQSRVTCEFIAAHVVTWDVRHGPNDAKVDAGNLTRFPEPIVSQLLDIVSRWAPAEQAAAEGN